jgi:hypothetical protein
MKLARRSLNGLKGIDLNSLMTQYGSEWGGLRPEVRQKVLERGFPGDIYGGAYGIMPTDPHEFIRPYTNMGLRPFGTYDNNGDYHPLYYSNGEPRLAYDQGDSVGIELVYDPNMYHFTLSDPQANGEWRYTADFQPAYASKWAPVLNGSIVQVQPNPYNHSWLSLGAAGGYRDPRLIDWSDQFGLVTAPSNVLYDQDSFWESWGPFILATLAIGGVAAGGIAAGAGGEAVASTAGTAATEAGAAATTAGTAGSTEAFVAGEEALREIGMAQALGATVTQGEAVGWVAALESAGLAVPADIAAIASGAAQGASASSGYQSPPSPPSGGSTAGSTASGASGTTSASSVLNTAGKVISNPLVKTAAGLIAAGGAASATGNNPAPNAGYSYASPDMRVDYTKSQAQTTGKISTSANWWWLLAAGAGVYFVKHKMGKKGRHHAPK